MAVKRSSYQFVRPRDLKFLEKFKILSEVAGSYVSLFTVTSGFTFSYSEMKIDKYEKILSESLSHYLSSPIAVEIQVAENLPYCSQSFSISVFEKDQLSYKSYFLVLTESTDQKVKDFKGLPTKNLPIICVTKSGKLSTLTRIHTYFGLVFKCRFIEKALDSDNFIWLWGILTNETIRRKKNNGLTVKYHVPNTPENTSIAINLDKDSLDSIWSCTRVLSENVMTLEEIQQFICGFEAHVRQTYSIKVSHFDVRTVTLEGATLAMYKNNTFKIKINDAGILYMALLFVRSDVFQEV